jgi:hypothetical protein
MVPLSASICEHGRMVPLSACVCVCELGRRVPLSTCICEHGRMVPFSTCICVCTTAWLNNMCGRFGKCIQNVSVVLKREKKNSYEMPGGR